MDRNDKVVIDTLDELLDKLSSDSVPIRYAAANKLGKLGDKGAVPYIIAALDDTNEKVKDNLIFALGELGDISAVNVLAKILATDKSDRLRKCAAKALGLIGSATATDDLISALGDDDFKVRKSAARALGQIGDKRAIPALKKALDDPDYTVTKYAEEALDRLSD